VTTLAVDGRAVELRRAVGDDLPALVALLADDPVGGTREAAPDAEAPDGEAELAPYRRAFALLDADPAHVLVVATASGDVVGTCQLTFIPGLARRGALRAQLEAVRVRADHRGRGLGGAMIGWAVEEAGRHSCALVQLTTDKRRPDARRFYERLGFVASHEGLKLLLEGRPLPADRGATSAS
jgi:GNAT superfamily N-acetyltransferase